MHPDPHVRNLVFQTLYEAGDQGPDIPQALVKAIDQYGWSTAFSYPYSIQDFAIDETTINWVIKRVSQQPYTHESMILFQWITLKTPISFLQEKMDDFKKAIPKKAEQFFLTEIRQLFQYYALPAEKCIELLHKEIRQLYGKEANTSTKIELLCKRLLEEEACRPELERLTHEWLSFDFNQPESVQHSFSEIAVYLAGLLNLRTAFPRLLEYFDYESDYLLKWVLIAIAPMRSLETLETLAELYRSKECLTRYDMVEIFACPHIPEAESLLFKLLEWEKDDELRMALAYSLALFGTPAAQNKAKEVFEEKSDAQDRLKLAEILYAQLLLEDNDHPDLPHWHSIISAALQAEADFLENDFFHDDVLGTFLRHDLPPQVPYTRDAKTGRNDPCPCGSGKKYKKCCLHSGN